MQFPSHVRPQYGRPMLVNRKAVEDEIERLIALLDRLDGDCDLEANGDERDANPDHDGEDIDQPWPSEVAA